MRFSRRDFLKAGAGAAALAATPRWLAARTAPLRAGAPAITDPDVRSLALRAIDAARGAGADYADARFTHTYERSVERFDRLADAEEMAVGVRALVDGYWGFASGPYWTPDEAARLGREAVAQARVNAMGGRRVVRLGTIAPVADGHWVTPVEVDPFEVTIDEVLDVVRGLGIYTASVHPGAAGVLRCEFYKQEKAFASTDGTYLTQVLHRTGGSFVVHHDDQRRRTDDRHPSEIGSSLLGTVARGWEAVRDAPLREEIPLLIERLEEEWRLPFKPVEVGRYDLIVDARGAASLVASTIGAATELDRALGYEANAGGTSYLTDPAAMLGTQEMGSTLLNVTADRSSPDAVATVRWDDEGVEPDDFALVKDGVLADFQTTREGAGWLAESYARLGRPVRSHGCAAAPSALHATMQHPPNIALAPGREAADIDELLAGMDKGIAVQGLSVDTDFQHLNAQSNGGRFYEIRRGRKVAVIEGGAILFRAPALWKSLVALGGRESFRWHAASMPKGEPLRNGTFGVGGVPARFEQVTMIDVRRRA